MSKFQTRPLPAVAHEGPVGKIISTSWLSDLAFVDSKAGIPYSNVAESRQEHDIWAEDERKFLLLQPGLGPCVVERLEAAGVRSLRALARIGVDVVVEEIVRSGGSVAWRNRLRALSRALSLWADLGGVSQPSEHLA